MYWTYYNIPKARHKSVTYVRTVFLKNHTGLTSLRPQAGKKTGAANQPVQHQSRRACWCAAAHVHHRSTHW
ncbi:unnamed protein product, partial [Trichogramma brassicae]